MTDHFQGVVRPRKASQDIFDSNKALVNACFNGIDTTVWSQLAADEAKEWLTKQLQQFSHDLRRPRDAPMVLRFIKAMGQTAPIGDYQLSGGKQGSPCWYHAKVYVHKASLGVLLAIDILMGEKDVPPQLRLALEKRGQENLLDFLRDPATYKTQLGEYHRDFAGDDETGADKRPSKVVVTKGKAPEDGEDTGLLLDLRPDVEKGWENKEDADDYDLLGPLRDRNGDDNGNNNAGDANFNANDAAADERGKDKITVRREEMTSLERQVVKLKQENAKLVEENDLLVEDTDVFMGEINQVRRERDLVKQENASLKEELITAQRAALAAQQTALKAQEAALNAYTQRE
ncbi:hypothetical protein PG984_005355 [Apiospora sp. TS-2023a]